MTRTALGKDVTITGALPMATITEPAASTGPPSETQSPQSERVLCFLLFALAASADAAHF
jgi:hypothetical protein